MPPDDFMREMQSRGAVGVIMESWKERKYNNDFIKRGVIQIYV